MEACHLQNQAGKRLPIVFGCRSIEFWAYCFFTKKLILLEKYNGTGRGKEIWNRKKDFMSR
ncbi:hypothetical protein A361_09980 [Cytobacillus oceanisediminis 2691]|jgi:hypothetical protein|uniref:Uncharacterized protein n=2 Tax=Cytobacillus oceanisediminis TaxID=665099 RepID=A0A160MAB6_9BACI|nr:hypothetical protein A361_09980 [Cytobacillus oceanisediminis 2691]OHX49482.1 hypothetical protein BBV17_12935 [Cytobacillus oceanisediminis]